MTFTQHTVRFARNPDDGSYRAHCTCGWVSSGARQDVELRACTHDLDDLPEIPETTPYQSGLPEVER